MTRDRGGEAVGMNGNFVYRTPKLSQFFSAHRRTWDQFYESERWVFERIIAQGGFGHVLDVGCAAGGLGAALAERDALLSYSGVDINDEAIAAARRLRSAQPSRFFCGDVIELGDFGRPAFDTVFSLSCADWNVETRRILERCWSLVAAGGRFVLSLRLSPGRSLLDAAESYQYLAFDEAATGAEERAPYVVFNAADALRTLVGLVPAPAHVLGYGYWGTPSPSARTPVERLVFAVFAVTKRGADERGGMAHLDLRLPHDVWGEPAMPL